MCYASIGTVCMEATPRVPREINCKVDNYGYGVRHVQATCMCAAIVALFAARSSMGVAVLAMTDDSRRNDTSVTIYDWDKKRQSLILSSFFWGYLVMQIPAGLLAKRFGGKPILLVALLTSAIICASLPLLVEILGSWQVVCACRVVMGLTQACLFPATHTMLGPWLPPHERTAFSGIIYSGTQLGIIIALPVSGLLAESALGWKLIFYAMSGALFATSAVWYCFAASTPEEHRWITEEEREYIARGVNASTGAKSFRTPWAHIFRSKALWAVTVTHIGSGIGYVLFFVDMPTYLEKALHISLKKSASLSALPYAGMLVGNIASALVSEKLFNAGLLSVVASRKIFNSIAFVGMALGLGALAYIGPAHHAAAVVTLVGALTASGFSSAGFLMSHLDMSPNYAGVLLSVTNFAATAGGVVTPIATSYMLRNDPTDTGRWRVLFLTVAAVYMAANTVFLVSATADRQPWNDPDFCDAKIRPEETEPLSK